MTNRTGSVDARTRSAGADLVRARHRIGDLRPRRRRCSGRRSVLSQRRSNGGAVDVHPIWYGAGAPPGGVSLPHDGDRRADQVRSDNAVWRDVAHGAIAVRRRPGRALTVSITRAITAVTLCAVLLIVANQIRLVIIGACARWFGFDQGFPLGHLLIGSLFSIAAIGSSVVGFLRVVRTRMVSATVATFPT